MSLRPIADHAFKKRRIVLALLDYPADQFVPSSDLAVKLQICTSNPSEIANIVRPLRGWIDSKMGTGIRLSAAGRAAALKLRLAENRWLDSVPSNY